MWVEKLATPTPTLSIEQVRAIVEEMTRRGCVINVKNSLGGYSVQVRGKCSADELIALQQNAEGVWGVMLHLLSEKAEREANEPITDKIERWRTSPAFSEEKGYDWGL